MGNVCVLHSHNYDYYIIICNIQLSWLYLNLQNILYQTNPIHTPFLWYWYQTVDVIYHRHPNIMGLGTIIGTYLYELTLIYFKFPFTNCFSLFKMWIAHFDFICLDGIWECGSRGQTFRCHNFVHLFMQSVNLHSLHMFFIFSERVCGTWCCFPSPSRQERVCASCTVYTCSDSSAPLFSLTRAHVLRAWPGLTSSFQSLGSSHQISTVVHCICMHCQNCIM